jgi:tRNA 5-methylaminomethyl-2-thiouridine biosynthesis bifunctional protein
MTAVGESLVVLQLGFGLGHNFLARWRTCRDAGPTGQRLQYISVDATPPSRDVLLRIWGHTSKADPAWSLIDQWPALTPNLHRLDFDDGRIELLLAVGSSRHWLHELILQADELRVDNVDTTSDPAGWPTILAKGLARLAAPGAALTSALSSPAMQHALVSAGFKIEAGDATTPSIDRLSACYAPAFKPRGVTPRRGDDAPRQALIVGAGLAGCAAAWALAAQGWRTRLLDRQGAPAAEASGNLAGLFHGIVNPQDGAHARFNRAAALEAQRAVHFAIERLGVKGQTTGVLRLESSGRTVDDMRAMLTRLALPEDYAQALDAGAASHRCGLPVQHPAWFFPGGGWVQPAGLAQAFLRRAGAMSEFVGSKSVHAIRRSQGLWHVHDASGGLIDSSATLILANAVDALRLMGVERWPVNTVRGQVSLFDQTRTAPADRLPTPAVPLAGDGYVLPSIDGVMLFGATTQAGDADPLVRDVDHAQNLKRLQRLSPSALPLRTELLCGRVGWRCVSDDRLPLIGAAPDEPAARSRHLERPGQVPRLPGLYVFTALGSRGIGWAALGGQVLAALVSCAAVPLERSLVEAIDPARFALRTSRRRLPQRPG